jgi:PAP2 superfamily
MMKRISARDRQLAGVAVSVMVALAFCLLSKDISPFKPLSYLTNIFVFIIVGIPMAVAVVIKTLLSNRAEFSRHAINSVFSDPLWRRRVISSIVAVGLLIAFMPVFSAMKSAIPLFNPFQWDGYFIDLDRLIHGDDAWKLLQPVIGYPVVTSALAGIYHSWLLLLYAGTLFFVFYHKQPLLRQRYLIAYFLSWTVVGVLLAIVFASVGPCFVEPITGRTDFVPQMEYLRTANEQYPVWVLSVQDLLLESYLQSDRGLGRGITAMPSMHVSQALLFFLAARHISKMAAWVAGLYLGLIMIGSVHLAYHYAVDGYVSIIVTAVIWKFSGWLAARSEPDEVPATALSNQALLHGISR